LIIQAHHLEGNLPPSFNLDAKQIHIVFAIGV